MKRIIIIVGILILISSSCRQPGKRNAEIQSFSNSYEATWESLAAHEIPEWLKDAKFGIYAHWGIYSVPAYGNEWYGKRMYDLDQDIHRHHVETYGDPEVFGYKDFIPMFRAEHYDPDDWADLIAGSGARFAGIALVHHDGFCLWDSKQTRWNSVNMGPGRDLYGELVSSLRKKENMKILATFHHIRTFNWYLPFGRGFNDPMVQTGHDKYLGKNWDIFDPDYGDLYWNEVAGRKQEDFIFEWNNKIREVIDKYRPDVIWFDGGQFQDEKNETLVMDLVAYYYNRETEWKTEVEILNKLPTSMHYNFPENVGMLTYEEGRDRSRQVLYPWIDDMKISERSWGYVEGQKYKDPDVIIDGLVDRVSRGGGLLLSLCPKADGKINKEQKYILQEMGDWLKVNGEAIYGTRTWKINAEGNEDKLIRTGRHSTWVYDSCNHEDFRFTTRDNTLYAFVLGWPDNGKLTIKSLGNNTKIASRGIREISLLGSDEKLNWSRTDQGLHLELPKEAPTKYASAFRIKVKGKLNR